MANKPNIDTCTWYCPAGHNVFDSSSYTNEDPPECASCGVVMTTDSQRYDDVHQAIEIREINEVQLTLTL